MADPRTSRFWLASIQSGLLDVSSLTACWEAIPPDKRDVPEHLDRRLARQAVQQNHLTLWQAQQLLAGRTNGFQVDRYLLLDLIGHGGMGRVYLARDTRLGRPVALKILAPERMSNPRAIARFQREARVGAQLQHENLVRIYDFGESNGRFFLVMEYIEGKTIGALINQQGPMPPQTAAQLARQIALGLEHAHRKGLIHRDVNPYNVLVTHDGIAKLADLGLAIDLAEEGRVTREGATVGTFDYVAPEQARHSHSADIRSDIYSLGCTLYHMIAGHVPFPSPSLPEKLFAHQALEPAPLSQIIPDVETGLVEVIQRMMRKEPAARLPTPLHVAQALEPFIGEPGRPHESMPGAKVLVLEESRREEDVLSLSASKPKAEELSPSVLKPERQLAGNSSEQQHQPFMPVPQSPTSSVSVQPPIPTEEPKASDAEGLISPFQVAEVNSHESIPLFLDLGQELPLSESLSSSKARTEVERPEKSNRLSIRPSLAQISRVVATLRHIFLSYRSRWVVGLGITLLLTTLLIVLYTFANHKSGVPGDRLLLGRNRTRASQPDLGDPPGHQAPDSASGRRGPSSHSESSFSVLTDDGDVVQANDLTDAMQIAMRAQGWVELHNRKPLTVSVIPEQMSSATNGWLKVRSAKGVKSILIVELKGQKPFLTVGSGTNFMLEGVELILNYIDRPQKEMAVPVIMTAGSVQIKNCVFKLKGNTSVDGSLAMISVGGNLAVENSYFEGLDSAVEVRASGGSVTEFRNTMIISRRKQPRIASPAVQTDFSGWGIKMIRYPGGRSSSRRLVLDQCTVTGEGLLQIDGFGTDLPLQVDVSECAIQCKTLIGWVAGATNTKWNPQTVAWSGIGNQLDITGSNWVTSIGKQSSSKEIEVLDRDKWLQLVKEHDPILGPIRFLGDPEAHPKTIQPEDYEVKQSTGRKAGASSKVIGPRG